jgi:hypothetical protein
MFKNSPQGIKFFTHDYSNLERFHIWQKFLINKPHDRCSFLSGLPDLDHKVVLPVGNGLPEEALLRHLVGEFATSPAKCETLATPRDQAVNTVPQATRNHTQCGGMAPRGLKVGRHGQDGIAVREHLPVPDQDHAVHPIGVDAVQSAKLHSGL